MERLIDRIDTYNIRLYAHCEMRTHYHALVETPQANLGRFMHSLNTAYTGFYNGRYRRHGHLFQGRYGAKPVEGDNYLLSLSRYIHLNPVHIRKVKALPVSEQLRHLHDFRWSSYRAYIGRAKTPDWLEAGPVLAQCGSTGKEQRQQYRQFVEKSLSEEDEELLSLLEGPRLAIGGDAFVDDIRARMIERMGSCKRREDVSLRHVYERLDPEAVLVMTGVVMEVEPAEFRVRRRNCVLRAVAARMLCKYAGLTQRETADVLGVSSSATVSKQQERLAEELKGNRQLRRRVGQLEARLATVIHP